MGVDDPSLVMYVLCRSKFGSTPTHQAKEGEMPINETLHRRERAIRAAQAATEEREQQLEDLTVANETLREENERLREALVAIRDHGNTHEYPCHALHQGDCADTMQEYARTALWTPTANVADPETF